MQESKSSTWHARGDAFAQSHMPGHGYRPSFWRIFQFCITVATQGIWEALGRLVCFLPRYLARRRTTGENRTDFTTPPALGHLGDVRVKVNVDVDFEEA